VQWDELKFGAVIFCKDFKFTDGGISDKLFIAIGVRSLHSVIAITTSQSPKTDIAPGCASQRNLFLLKKTPANKLDKDTYVLLNKLGILDPTMMKEKRFQDATIVLTLPEHDAHALKNCAAYCEDVAPAYRALLGPPLPAKTPK
jgi:hypothetical protein